MRNGYFLLILLGCYSILPLQAQDTEADLRYEVENLREQITLIIQNNNRSLIEMDDELATARQRIRNLKTENDYLKKRMHTRGDDNLSTLAEDPATLKASQKISRLERDNHFLREALRLEKDDAARELIAKENRIELLTQQKHLLLNQNDSLRRLSESLETAAVWQAKFTTAEDRSLKLEVENKALWQQAKSTAISLKKELEKQAQFSQKLEQKLGAAEARNEELESQMRANLAFMKNTMGEKRELILHITRLQRHIDSLGQSNQQVAASLRYEPITEQFHQRMDSLTYENTALKRQVDILNSAEGVKRSRIRDLEAREADVREALLKMEIRDRLLRDRERELELQRKELEMQELKYKGLQEKEVRLKMIEQQLREAVKQDVNK